MNRQTDGQTDGQTDPLIEMQGPVLKYRQELSIRTNATLRLSSIFNCIFLQFHYFKTLFEPSHSGSRLSLIVAYFILSMYIPRGSFSKLGCYAPRSLTLKDTSLRLCANRRFWTPKQLRLIIILHRK